VDSGRPKEPCISWGVRNAPGKGAHFVEYFGMAWLARVNILNILKVICKVAVSELNVSH